MTSVRVAVVVACFNDGGTLGEALDSLRGEARHELVVVNDGSTDPATLAVLADLRAAGVNVIDQENTGLPGARMTGVAATTAPYVLPLDADDRVMPGSVGALADALDADADLAAAWGDQQLFGDYDLVSPRARELDPWAITHVNGLPVSTMIRRTDLLAAGGWALRGGYEDWDLWMALAERGRRGRHIGRATHGYRIHGRRMLVATRARHAEQFALLRARHPQLFARRRAAWRTSSAPLRLRLLIPLAEHVPGLPSALRRRLVLFIAWPAHGIRMRRAARRSEGRDPAPAAPTSGS
jgi:glycosyltransferase involved in cell wall biosynthesis